MQGSTTGCPRQPWHDLHCQIDGPAVYDILANFQERWLKASPRGIKKLKRVYDDYLIHIDKVPTIIGQLDADQSCHNEEDDIESWHVQVNYYLHRFNLDMIILSPTCWPNRTRPKK